MRRFLAGISAAALLVASAADAQTVYPAPGGGGSGTVTTTGSPANGNLTAFSGATSVTNTDLTGDVTTSGAVATTLATVNTNVGSFTSANITVNGKGLITAAANGGSNPFPAPISGNWYMPPFTTVIAGSATSTSTTLNCGAQYVPFTITVKGLGVRVTTAAAAGNVQVGIYANNAATGRPTGAVLGVTASMSTTSATLVTAALVGSNFTLTPGIYWACAQVDNSTAELQTTANADTQMSAFIGSATPATVNSGGPTTQMRLFATSVFGTWSAGGTYTWTENAGSSYGVVMLQSN